MERSQSVVNIAAALSKFRAGMEPIPKTSSNPFFKSKYADLEAIDEAIKENLWEQELTVVTMPDHIGVEPALTVLLVHASGEWMEGTIPLSLVKAGPQDEGAAMTYMRRYATSAVLNLITDDDDDGNSASQPQDSTRGQQRQSAPASNQAPQGVVRGNPPAGKKRTQYSWSQGAKPPPPDPNAEKAKDGQHKRLFAIAASKGIDLAGAIAFAFQGRTEHELNWKEVSYLADAMEDGWLPVPAPEPVHQVDEGTYDGPVDEPYPNEEPW